jgi:hypothetical protein
MKKHVWMLLATLPLSVCGGDRQPAIKGLPLRQEWTIGGANDTVNLFNFVNDLYVDSEGFVFVTDLYDDGVRIFDSDGHFVRRFGEKGEGPDKVVFPGKIAVGNDSVFLFQRKDLRIFDRHGKWLNTTRAAIPGVFMDMVHSDAGLTVYLEQMRVDNSVPGYAIKGAVSGCYTVIRDGSLQLGTCPFSYKKADILSFGIGFGTLPFAVSGSIALSREGRIYGAEGSTYEISEANPSGKARTIRRPDVVPESTTSKEVDAAFDRLRADLTRGLEALPALGVESRSDAAWKLPESFDYAQIPNVKPVIGRLVAGDSGELLVLRPDESGAGNDVWDYLDAEARVLGQVILPNEVRVVWLGRCELYGIKRDELDVESIVRYHIGEPCDDD